MSSINKIEFFLENNFINYWEQFIVNLDNFVENLNLDDEFNFTYISLTILIKKFRNQYYDFLKFYTKNIWFNLNGEYNIDGKYKYLGLDDKDLLLCQELVDSAVKEKSELWESALQNKLKSEYNFCLFREYIFSNDIRSKFNRDMISALDNQVYNVEEWWVFVKNIFLESMRDFKVDEKNYSFYRNFNSLKLIVKINPLQIIDLNYLLRKSGVFDFGFEFYIEYMEHNVLIKKFPKEISSPLSDLMYKNYKMAYKNASHEEAKVRVYANITAYCQLLNVLTKSLFDLFEDYEECN